MKKIHAAPFCCIAVSLAVSAARRLLPGCEDKYFLFFFLQCAAYFVNFFFSGQADFRSVNMMGVPLVALTAVAAVIGWLSWAVPVMHLVLTLVCIQIKVEDPDPNWTEEEQRAYRARRRLPYYRRHK